MREPRSNKNKLLKEIGPYRRIEKISGNFLPFVVEFPFQEIPQIAPRHHRLRVHVAVHANFDILRFEPRKVTKNNHKPLSIQEWRRGMDL